jgi:hypothetical protein|tara:strand:+ start:147 stop:287 length:141 start_codon:yes stop_codon:yes gene_type:complete
MAAVPYFEYVGPPSSPPITYKKQKSMLQNKKMKTYQSSGGQNCKAT